MTEPNAPPIGALVAPVTPFQQNCTLIWCTRTRAAAIIDPGGEVDGLIELVKSRGLDLQKIFVTHGHLDHCGGAAELREKTSAPIEGPHPDDAFWIDRIETTAPEWGMRGARSFTPDRWLADGDVVELGEASFEVLHCPGHTPGHVVFFHRQMRFAQVGDVLFRGSIGRTDFPRGNHEQLIASITGKLWPLGDDVRFVPGHGPMSSFGEERRSNPFVADAVLAQGDA
jgi:glyoxylase-like metal-dependent hydrolase (beta-lactamase superfamily II)